MDPHEGRKAFTLQMVPARERTTKLFLATHAGFSLHAGVAVGGGDRKILEHLCRYITLNSASTKPVATQFLLPRVDYDRVKVLKPF